jgi:hypothetical protein
LWPPLVEHVRVRIAVAFDGVLVCCRCFVGSASVIDSIRTDPGPVAVVNRRRPFGLPWRRCGFSVFVVVFRGSDHRRRRWN